MFIFSYPPHIRIFHSHINRRINAFKNSELKFSKSKFEIFISKYRNMKITITLEQLKRVLRTQPTKPIVFKVANFNEREMLELSKMFQEKERD